MKKFKVKTRRTYEIIMEVEVNANNKDEAHDIVYNDLGDVEIYRLDDENLEVDDIKDEIFEIIEIEDDESK